MTQNILHVSTIIPSNSNVIFKKIKHLSKHFLFPACFVGFSTIRLHIFQAPTPIMVMSIVTVIISCLLILNYLLIALSLSIWITTKIVVRLILTGRLKVCHPCLPSE